MAPLSNAKAIFLRAMADIQTRIMNAAPESELRPHAVTDHAQQPPLAKRTARKRPVRIATPRPAEKHRGGSLARRC